VHLYEFRVIVELIVSAFSGVRCETLCPRGTYGEDCQNECDCHNDSSCDQKTAKCTCTRGWEGPKCDLPCKPNKYGFGCREECPERHSDGMSFSLYIIYLYYYISILPSLLPRDNITGFGLIIESLFFNDHRNRYLLH